MIYDKVLKILEENGVKYKIHQHESVYSIKDVEEKLSFPKSKLLKTLVFKIRGAFWILAVIAGEDRVDYRKLAKVFGVNRSMVEIASPEEIESKLGFQIGGICPIRFKEDVDTTVIFDQKVVDKIGLDVIYCGVGRNDRTLEINFRDLLKVSNGEVSDISSGPSQEKLPIS